MQISDTVPGTQEKYSVSLLLGHSSPPDFVSNSILATEQMQGPPADLSSHNSSSFIPSYIHSETLSFIYFLFPLPADINRAHLFSSSGLSSNITFTREVSPDGPLKCKHTLTHSLAGNFISPLPLYFSS